MNASYSLLVGINKSQSEAVSFNEIQLSTNLVKQHLTLCVFLQHQPFILF